MLGDECLCVCVCFRRGGGQTSTQVPNTVNPPAVSQCFPEVFPPFYQSPDKASKSTAGDTHRRGGINPACDPLGKQSVGGAYFPRTLVSEDRGEESRYGRAPARLSL